MNTTTSSRTMSIRALPIAPPIMVAETPVSEAPMVETLVEEAPEAVDSVERAVELVGIPV